MYTCTKDGGFSIGTFDILGVLKLSLDKQNCVLRFDVEKYLSLCHTNAQVQFLALWSYLRVLSIYIAQAISRFSAIAF